MDTYSLLREIADSWVLLAMFSFFVGSILWAFRPGGSRVYEDVSRIPLREDVTVPYDIEAPAPLAASGPVIRDETTPEGKSCAGTCATCECSLTIVKGLQDV